MKLDRRQEDEEGTNKHTTVDRIRPDKPEWSLRSRDRVDCSKLAAHRLKKVVVELTSVI